MPEEGATVSSNSIKFRNPGRQLVVYAALLTCSFGATYGYLALQRGGLPRWVPRSVPAANVAGTAGVRPVAGNSSAVVPADGLTRPPAPTDATVDYTALERRQAGDAIADASQALMSSASAEERSAALTRLGAMAGRLENSPQPELLQALGAAATDAPEWQLRNRAVIAIASAAQRMADKSQAMALLERAALDPHKAVATRARVALRTLQAAAVPGMGIAPN